jgi:hypothetical protein
VIYDVRQTYVYESTRREEALLTPDVYRVGTPAGVLREGYAEHAQVGEAPKVIEASRPRRSLLS